MRIPTRTLATLGACAGLTLAAGGCFKGLSELQPFPCARATQGCPEGFFCSEGQCVPGSEPSDAGAELGDAAEASSGDAAGQADAGSASGSDATGGLDASSPADALSPEWALWPVPPEAPRDYSASDAGTVTDNVTGLVWQQVAANPTYDWDGAKSYCHDLYLGGSTGWSLPTAIELLSIVDSSVRSPSIDSAVFSNTSSDHCWTSSTVAHLEGTHAWTIEFDRGRAHQVSQGNNYQARCVKRPGTTPSVH
ncbi:MAG: DUF1566 domain-containing protein, partial [Deltaproteobacteria bacterium]|nr:DUF1566 domain-containing protein [Deltaproteobacteria bacterium]